MRLNLKIKILLILVSIVFLCTAYAKDIYLNLSEKAERKFFILVENFTQENNTSSNLCKKLTETLKNDLRKTDIFIVEEKIPDFLKTEEDKVLWIKTNLDFIFSAVISKTSKTISGKLVDIKSDKNILVKNWHIKENNWENKIHYISDDITMFFTGYRGICNTKIAFAAITKRNIKEIFVVDINTKNIKQITNYKSISILPRWHPTKNKLIYTSYTDTNPDLYCFDLKTKTHTLISNKQGLNIAANYSPKGDLIILTMTINGDPELCLIKSDGTFIKRLTYTAGVDTSPTWSPDGSKIAFISERTGAVQIYIMKIKNKKTNRITKTSELKDSLSWSPLGNKILYSAYIDNKWNIFFINVKSKEITQLTNGNYNNENPHWSGDGRKICFTSTRFGKKELFIMDSDGANQKKLINMSKNVHTPRWSPSYED